MGGNWDGKGYYPSVSQPLMGTNTIAKQTSPTYLYGMLLKPRVFDLDYLHMVITHEVGHMLGLAHTYNDSDCTGDADWCDDTPVYNRILYNAGSNNRQRTSCNGQTFTSTNYMDYYWGYNNSFTLDQAKRARHVINYGFWLPTPFNGRSLGGGRQSAAPGYVQRPAVIANIKPVACSMPLKLPKALGW